MLDKTVAKTVTDTDFVFLFRDSFARVERFLKGGGVALSESDETIFFQNESLSKLFSASAL